MGFKFIKLNRLAIISFLIFSVPFCGKAQDHQHDLEIGFNRYHIPNPGSFPLSSVRSVHKSIDQDIAQRNITPSDDIYRMKQFYATVTRHVAYGRHKRSEIALGLSFGLQYKDRLIFEGNNKIILQDYASDKPHPHQELVTQYENYRLYDQYHSVSLAPVVISRYHINQRFSINGTFKVEAGLPFLNQIFVTQSSLVNSEVWDNGIYSKTSDREYVTRGHSKPFQMHWGINTQLGLSYKLFQYKKIFLETAYQFGVRNYISYRPEGSELYFGPSVGLRAYL